ncbi:MAG: hypothetical protein K9L78_02895 [Victivallales bacterium]|nr:hypothetical protein [Victivallales bacterium]
MQRKSNSAMLKMQAEKLITVGIDMGSSSWSCGYYNWNTGRYSYKHFKGDDKDNCCYQTVSEYIRSNYKVHVFYEAGRNGFTPARIIKKLGAAVTILPVGKLVVLSSGKRVKTDRIDSRFLSELHPEDKVPSVYIPTIEEESKSSLLREQERIEKGKFPTETVQTVILTN